MRDHNTEHQDNAARQYAYKFDGVLRRYLLASFSGHMNRGGSALELGCYTGNMTEQILDYFPTVTVVEAASDLAEMVRQRFGGRVTVVVSRLEDAELPADFDNVFLIHTLEHLDDPVTTLRRILRWLRPGGRLFVAVPNANALSRQIAVRMGLIDFNSAVAGPEEEQGHRITYSMDRLLHDLHRAGLEVIDHGGVVVKTLANFQFDKAIESGIVSEGYLDACNELAKTYPDLSASLFAVCGGTK